MSVDPNEVPRCQSARRPFRRALRTNWCGKDTHPELFAHKGGCSRDLSDWLLKQQLAAGDLTSGQVDRFLRDRRSAGITRHKTRKALGPILGLSPRVEGCASLRDACGR